MNEAEMRRLFEAVSSLETADEAEAFFHDLCTPREIEDLSQRLEVAALLAEGHSYLDVSRSTGASSTTVSRVSKCLNGARGGYRLVLGRTASAGNEASDDIVVRCRG